MCERLVGALGACADVALSAKTARSVTVAFGDCTPSSCVDPEQLRQGSIPIEWTAFGENLGHGRGQNRLAHGAGEDVLVMINPDAYPAPAALHELLLRLAEPGVGLAEGRQLPFETPRYVDPVTWQTPWCAGTILGISLPLFRELGGFDESFFLQGDDVDLSLRVRAQGRSTSYVPRATVFHARGIDPAGYATSNETEAFHAHLADLLIAWKAKAYDEVRRMMDQTDRDGHPWQREANEHFRSLQAHGALPEPYGFDARPFLDQYRRRRF
jgi:GT2 family glycosyltransferase